MSTLCTPQFTTCQLSVKPKHQFRTTPSKKAMLNALQPPKEVYHTLRETLFVRFVFTILTPFIFILGTLLRSHYRKVNGERTPGLTRYRQ